MNIMTRTDLKLTKTNYKIGVVTARFNDHITSKLLDGAMNVLSGYGITSVESVEVAGAFEIPLAGQWLLESGCDAVLGLGVIVRGETTHYDYVCSAVEKGTMRIQLDQKKPFVFGILTTENEEQAFDRCGGNHGHKGEEAALVALEMLELKNRILS